MAGVIVMHILMPALGEEETRAVVGAYCQATHVQAQEHAQIQETRTDKSAIHDSMCTIAQTDDAAPDRLQASPNSRHRTRGAPRVTKFRPGPRKSMALWPKRKVLCEVSARKEQHLLSDSAQEEIEFFFFFVGGGDLLG
jgi:hypothetical protein